MVASESTTGVSRQIDGGDLFRQLPSVKLLTDQIEQARIELQWRWSSADMPDTHPLLMGLWLTARAQSRLTLRDRPDDRTARELTTAWNHLDDRYGDPLERGWEITSREAARRFEVLTDYFTAAGELSVLKVERDAPEEFISKKETDGT
jgi:hypothetical protein